MKKMFAVLMILAMVLMSGSAMAQDTRKEQCLDKIQIVSTEFVEVIQKLEEMRDIWNDEQYGPAAADEITAQDVTDAGYTDISVAEFQSAMAQIYDILDNWQTAAKMAELRKVARY
jgi:hypothetical protein